MAHANADAPPGKRPRTTAAAAAAAALTDQPGASLSPVASDDEGDGASDTASVAGVFDDFYLSDVHLAPEHGSVDGHWRWFTANAQPEISTAGGSIARRTRARTAAAHFCRQALASRPIRVRFRFGTTLQGVGKCEQVWPGALLLAEFLAHRYDALFPHGHGAALELGSGTGLCGAVLARFGLERVYCTDTGDAVLRNCRFNLDWNAGDGVSADAASTVVRRLDWLNLPPWLCAPDTLIRDKKTAWAGSHDIKAADPVVTKRSNVEMAQDATFDWTPEDIRRIDADVRVFLAADVIYDDTATSAFLATAAALLRPRPHRKFSPVLYIASEKRLNFSIDELRVTASAHNHFFSELRHYPQLYLDTSLVVSDIPQLFSYLRSDQLLLWRLSWDPKSPHGPNIMPAPT
ncbi:hypothetical protein THASP1DRAFT_30319 [Thamnocephalis sphaerospora]|uniref:Methyltransferase-domain-containing protein n=1 Tax=Thamnocephalis sphaerospora TaxID=78915 RepID=A0A4P9XPD6_9FUNG|nr:hypothetical protein THASP1DRAFT_30319 [Thamnocephalis sphaerospora]|eukprot:RKP07864.1 hypothetical protein THASP1DRAFT_30319 [Thamnocephalis sphaerospora]